MQAEIYYPIIDQSPYGNVSKTWTFDRTIPCNFVYAGTKEKQELTINIEITTDSILIGRIKSDPRKSSFGEIFATTNIVITNIRNNAGEIIYNESAGPRSGNPTLFEIATLSPIVGPFGKVEYYKIVLRRSENQAVDL
jgi:hypothetical protein